MVVATGAVAVAIGILAAMSGLHPNVGDFHGGRLLAVLGGAAALAAAVYFFQRGIRRRSRMKAIADLLPHYRAHRSDNDFLFAEPDLDAGECDRSGRMPIARAEIHAATRALLVSLEEEVRRETGRARRTGRPVCRGVRLRLLGRTEPRRRRTLIRFATIPS